MQATKVGGRLLEFNVFLNVLSGDLRASAIECAIHDDSGRIAHTAIRFVPQPSVKNKLVQEIWRRSCGLGNPEFLDPFFGRPSPLGEIKSSNSLILPVIPAPIVSHGQNVEWSNSSVRPAK